MLEKVFQNYFKHFKCFLPYLLIKLVFNTILLKVIFIQFKILEVLNIYKEMDDIKQLLLNKDMRTFVISGVIFIIVSLLVEPIFNGFISLIMKKILDNENIDQTKIIKESLRYYWRYLGVSLAVFFIAILFVGGMLLVAFIPVIGMVLLIGGVVFMIYIVTTFEPCSEYLIYNDVSAEDALRDGRMVGKKFFWSIFLLGVCTQVIDKILDALNTENILVICITYFISTAVEIFAIFYRMHLCKNFKDRIDMLEINEEPRV